MTQFPIIRLCQLGFVEIDGLVVMDLNEYEDRDQWPDEYAKQDAEEAANLEAVKAKWGDDKIQAALDFIAPEIDAYEQQDEFIITINPELFRGVK